MSFDNKITQGLTRLADDIEPTARGDVADALQRGRRKMAVRATGAVLAASLAVGIAVAIPGVVLKGSSSEPDLVGPAAPIASPTQSQPASPSPAPTPTETSEPAGTPSPSPVLVSPQDDLPFTMDLPSGWSYAGRYGENDERVLYEHEDGSTFTVFVDAPRDTEDKLKPTHTYLDTLVAVGDDQLTWSRGSDFCNMWLTEPMTYEESKQHDYAPARYEEIDFRCDLNHDRKGSSFGFYFREDQLGYPLRGHSYFFQLEDPVEILPRDRIEQLFAGFRAR